MFLKILQNSQKNTCTRVSFQACNFTKKETLAQVFSCEFCKISMNTFFTEQIQATASGLKKQTLLFASLKKARYSIGVSIGESLRGSFPVEASTYLKNRTVNLTSCFRNFFISLINIFKNFSCI